MYNPEFPLELGPLYNYFYNNYIGDEGSNVLFPISIWNNKENLHSDLPRTNNAIEGLFIYLLTLQQGWHNAFRASFGTLNKIPRTLLKSYWMKKKGCSKDFCALKTEKNYLERGNML